MDPLDKIEKLIEWLALSEGSEDQFDLREMEPRRSGNQGHVARPVQVPLEQRDLQVRKWIDVHQSDGSMDKKENDQTLENQPSTSSEGPSNVDDSHPESDDDKEDEAIDTKKADSQPSQKKDSAQ